MDCNITLFVDFSLHIKPFGLTILRAVTLNAYSLHFFSVYKGMTTYDYIVKQRLKDMDRQAEAELDTGRNYKGQRKKVSLLKWGGKMANNTDYSQSVGPLWLRG